MSRTRTTRSEIRLRSLDVIVVDDDRDSRGLMHDVLEAHGCIARSVASALAAFDEVHTRRPHVVVTDLRLAGGAAGWTLAAALREHPETSSIRLVAVSGIVEPEWRVVQSFDAYLRKPIEVRHFVEVVHQLGERRITLGTRQSRQASNDPR